MLRGRVRLAAADAQVPPLQRAQGRDRPLQVARSQPDEPERYGVGRLAPLGRCGRYPLLRACREDEPALRLQLARSCQPDASLPRFGYVRDERVLSHLPRTRMCEDRLWVDLLPVSMQATLPPQQSDAFLARLRRQGLA